MSTETDTRYSRAAIASVITEALVNCDYAQTAEWIRPGTCPCHATGITSCVNPAMDRECQGHVQDIPLPPGKALTADELVSALPEPDSQGLISAIEAGSVLGRMASTRLSWSPYRRMTMFAALGEAMDAYEESLSPGKGTAVPAAAPGSAARCMVCSAEMRGSKASRKTCSDNCRATLCRRRRQARR